MDNVKFNELMQKWLKDLGLEGNVKPLSIDIKFSGVFDEAREDFAQLVKQPYVESMEMNYIYNVFRHIAISIEATKDGLKENGIDIGEKGEYLLDTLTGGLRKDMEELVRAGKEAIEVHETIEKEDDAFNRDNCN